MKRNSEGCDDGNAKEHKCEQPGTERGDGRAVNLKCVTRRCKRAITAS